MTTIKKTWTTQTGKEVTARGELITSKSIYADGHRVETSCCEIHMDVAVEGHGSQGDQIVDLAPGQMSGYTHRVGKLALTAEQAEIIRNIRRELEMTAEWQAHQAQLDRNRAAHAATASAHLHNGLCPRCETYCDGDCQS